MRDILFAPKSIHFAGTAAYKTANHRDMTKLIDACFSMNHQDWSTGQDHPVPALKDMTPSVEDIAVSHLSTSFFERTFVLIVCFIISSKLHRKPEGKIRPLGIDV